MCQQTHVTDTLLRVENSVFCNGESWSTGDLRSGGITFRVNQFSYNIDVLVINTTLHGNQAASGGGNMFMLVYSNKRGCNLISVSIEHCSITEGRAWSAGGLFVGNGIDGDEPHQCNTKEPQYTLHITDVQFVNNTAHFDGGNILIWDNSSVGNQINITNSSIIGGKAQIAGALYIILGSNHNIDPIVNKWNDSDHCNTPITKFSEKRWTI